jgi:hemerythrin-like domain-containing protein
VLESLEEHSNVKAMLKKIDKIEGNDETFDAKIKTLKELISHHVQEEENELFPKCFEILGDETLGELGEEMQKKIDHHPSFSHH